MFKIICGQQCNDKCLSICRKTFVFTNLFSYNWIYQFLKNKIFMRNNNSYVITYFSLKVVLEISQPKTEKSAFPRPKVIAALWKITRCCVIG